AVLVEPVAVAGWTVGGAAVGCGAHLDAKITRGTNSAEEKARFIAAAHALLAEVLGPDLPLATYVVVDEVPGEAWGYAGLTQAHRAAERRAA
ncbi:tautomerase family protein, partial [Methylobacterium sp. CCH5-D2]